jgi:hypothetical protein
VNRLIRCLIFSLLTAAGLGLVGVIVEKTLALQVVSPFLLMLLAGLGGGVGLIVWRLTRPGRMTLSLMLDQRAGLRERMSSLLAFEKSDDPFARAAVAESRQVIESIRPKDFFPIEIPRKIFLPISMWGLVVLCWMILPQGDLLGRRAEREEIVRKEVEIKQTQARAEAAIKKVKALSEKMNKDLLGDMPEEVTKTDANVKSDPKQARRLAVRKISDLQKRVEQARANSDMKGMEELERRLRQLRSPDVGPARELAQQLARGQFDQAAASLKKLQDQLASKDLTPEQRAKLAEQLRSLSEQMEKLAQQKWKLENELKKEGLDPALAKDLEKLKKALEKTNLDPEAKKKIIEMARANLSACKSCRGLSESLSAAASAMASGGANDPSAMDALAEAADQLSQLEAMNQQLQMTDATLADLENAMKDLWEAEGSCSSCGGKGCSMCGGNKKGPWQAGQSANRSMGMGGPGQGQGHVSDVEETATDTKKTRAKGKNNRGPVIASWYIQDQEIRGESVREFSVVTESAAQEASEAIQEQHIPKEYQESIKKYFGQLRSAADQKGK